MTSSLNSYSFVTTEAIIMKMHDNRMRIVVKTNMKFHRFLSNVSLANTEIIAVHYKSWRHILDSPGSGYPGVYKLISIHHSVSYVKIFHHRLISEVSRYNIFKFDQITPNSLQVIKIVHELFVCPSYMYIYCTIYDGNTLDLRSFF